MTNVAAHVGRHSGTSCLIDLRLRGLESVSPLHLLTLLLQECIPPPPIRSPSGTLLQLEVNSEVSLNKFSANMRPNPHHRTIPLWLWRKTNGDSIYPSGCPADKTSMNLQAGLCCLSAENARQLAQSFCWSWLSWLKPASQTQHMLTFNRVISSNQICQRVIKTALTNTKN